MNKKTLTNVALRYRAVFLDINREDIDMKAKAQNLTLVERAEDADEAYTYEWALNPAEVTKLLNG